jgi:hypothetical protein
MSKKKLVLKTDESQKNIPSTLGISDERANCLIDSCKKSISKTDTLTESIKEVTEEAENLEEFAFICFELGVMHGIQKGVKIGSDPLLSIFHQIAMNLSND